MSTADSDSAIEWRGDEVREKLLRITMRAMDRIMSDCVVIAKELAPTDTTFLQGSIQMRPTVLQGKRALVGYWGSFNCKYAIYQEMGTGLYAPGGGSMYEIRPRLKKALWWPGLEHPLKVVRHPGVRPRPYLRPAADTVYPALPQYIREEFAA